MGGESTARIIATLPLAALKHFSAFEQHSTDSLLLLLFYVITLWISKLKFAQWV